jgi:hypothetical protein
MSQGGFMVSRTLGHSRPATTLNIYVHLLPEIQAEGAQVIEGGDGCGSVGGDIEGHKPVVGTSKG